MFNLRISKPQLVFALLLWASLTVAQNRDFKFRSRINNTSPDGWFALPLSPDLFQSISRDFSDLRIYQFKGKDTTEIPYLLQVREDVVDVQPVEVNIFNRSKKDGKLYFTFEFARGQKVNHLDLAFNEKNFNGYAQLEGSPDQKEWFAVDTLQRILAIDKENIQFKATSLNFPPSEYRFLRLQIQADVGLTLDSASFKQRLLKPGVLSQIPLTWSAVSSKKSKETVIDMNLGQFQPVGSLTFELDYSQDFYRRMTIETLRDSARTPQGWTYYYDLAFSGYLTSLDNHHFDFPYTLAKKVRVTIYNADNEPLAVKSISALGPQVVLLAQFPAGESFLYFGNSKLSAPSYDVVHFKDKIPEGVSSLSAGPQERLVPEPVRSSPLFENKLWLWAIMGIIIAVLGFFTMKMMRANT